jgi:hypothetical protein
MEDGFTPLIALIGFGVLTLQKVWIFSFTNNIVSL